MQGGRPGFDPWVGKIPWRRERLPTPVFWPGESHGLYRPWGHKESDTTERLSLSTFTWAQNQALNFFNPPGDSNAHPSVRTYEPSSDADPHADAMGSVPPMAPHLRDLPRLFPHAAQLNLGIYTSAHIPEPALLQQLLQWGYISLQCSSS